MLIKRFFLQICYYFSIILNMNLLSCFCSKPSTPKSELDIKSPYFKQISQHLNDKEVHMLKLIYQDLAFRDDYKKLTNTNFLLFFNLKGLWGAKLFQKFDQQKNSLLSCEQFLLGMSKNLLIEARTAKASYQQKIKMLYSFLVEEGEDGIQFKQFIKMLYNYSKEELKEILLEDGVLVEEMLINTPICQDKQKKLSVIQVDYLEKHKQVTNQCANLYQKAFKQLISEYKDPGTCIQFRKDNQQYRLKYCNMISLVRQFAQRIYKKYHINQKTERLNFEQFKEWISGNMKLFHSYYSVFHRNIWQYHQQTPDYLSEQKVQLKTQGKLFFKNQLKNVIAMHVGDTILFCQSSKKVDYPFKVICLEGLTIKNVNDKTGFGIQINHTSSFYDRSVLYFQKMSVRDEWIEHLKIYEGDSLQKKYIIGEAIGTGKFSIVYKCKDRQTGQNYALKVIQTQKLDQKALASIKKQSEIMKIVNHPQIIKYKETIITKGYIYIITELAHGEDLFQYVKKRKNLSQVQSAFIIGLIMNAVVYLHNMDILHRDLKPQNILVVFKKKYRGKLASLKNYSSIQDYSPIQTIKIIDFGFADHLSILNSQNSPKIVNGTPHYISPQILLGKSYSQKCDSFAIGSILYFLLRGRHTFCASTQQEVLLKTVKGQYILSDDFWLKISQQAKDLVKSLLQKNPNFRISIQEAQNHKWFNNMPWNQYEKQPINEQDIIINNISLIQQKYYQKSRSLAQTNSESQKIQLPLKRHPYSTK